MQEIKHYTQGSFVLLSFYGELLVIYQCSSNFACPCLGASLFGCLFVFRKYFVLDRVLMADMIPLDVTTMLSNFSQEP